MRVAKIMRIASVLSAAQATTRGLRDAAANRNRVELELELPAGSLRWRNGDREYANLMRSITMSLGFSTSTKIVCHSPPSEFEWLPRGIADEGVELLV